jgi:hypothetical protein
MSFVSQVLSEAQSWLGFFFFSVLPIAFQELGRWLYQWQILAAGILAVLAARIWGRAIVRSARIAATAQSYPGVSPRGSFAAAPRAEPRPSKVPVPAAAENTDPIQSLRETIRTTLGTMPYTDEPLTRDRMALCSRVLQFPIAELAAKSPKAVSPKFEALQRELAALGNLSEKNTCRNAWETLVRVNNAARELMESRPRGGKS